MVLTPTQIKHDIAKGAFKPHVYLTNLCLAFFQGLSGFVAKRMFPVVPVQMSTGLYYMFDKGDLARDNVARKSAYGKVAPAVFGKRDKHYSC